MDNNKSWTLVIAMLALTVLIFFIQAVVIKWAVSMFYPISMSQAYAIIFILDMISIAFKKSR